MEVKNLRKGNRILFQGNEIEVAITDLCNMEYPMDELTKDMYKPIELNEEWLDRMPQFNNNYTWQDKTTANEIYIDVSDGIVYISDQRDTNYSFTIECKYVHALQNVFELLTGNELEITKP